jgi:hypothetical protein
MSIIKDAFKDEIVVKAAEDIFGGIKIILRV